MPIQILAERVAIQEYRQPIVDIPKDAIEEITHTLKKEHLPYLEATQFVQIHQENTRVSLTDYALTLETEIRQAENGLRKVLTFTASDRR